MEFKHPATSISMSSDPHFTVTTAALEHSSGGESHEATFSHVCSTTAVEEAEQEEFEKPFYFETDHVALRGNKDYCSLLRAVVLLEAQRTRAIGDLDRLLVAQDKALADPICFVRKLQHKVDLKLPRPQTVAAIPHINWQHYSAASSFSYMHRHQTRNKKSDVLMTNGGGKEINNKVSNDSHHMDVQFKETDNRSHTFNKAWSVEEQQRLEQLLVEFPPEEVEAKRWHKVAKALGNRTMLQVASRVQKYFIKLAKAGLPIPGRMPNLNTYFKKGSSHRHQRHNRFYHCHSTFMASHQAPVYMADDESDMQYLESPTPSGSQHTEHDVSDDECIPHDLRHSEEYHQIMRLKQLRQQKQEEERSHLTKHTGFRCDSCRMDPIVGTRWHCLQCPEEVSIDFCSDCVDMNYENDLHRADHDVQPVHKVQIDSHVDKDYSAANSYLDPNYMPAS